MRVISYSLYGSDPMYRQGAFKNIELRDAWYPGWTCRFYVGDSIPDSVRADLATHPAVDLVPMPGRREDWSACGWRFRTVLDDEPDVHVVRDCDSRPDSREQAAVNEWLASGKQFHIMRDHPEHGVPILGGMWGVTREGARRVRRLIPDGLDGGHYQVDQQWLRSVVYPIARKSAMVHTSAASPQFEPDGFDDKRDFPTKRDPGRFVGQGFNGDDTLRIPADALRV